MPQSDADDFLEQAAALDIAGISITTPLKRAFPKLSDAAINTLRWNEYEEWDSAVAYYNIYRGTDGEPA